LLSFDVPGADGSGLASSSLARLQFPDVLDDLVDLRVGEGCTERGHRALLAGLLWRKVCSETRLLISAIWAAA
jgi:hypothetical protein